MTELLSMMRRPLAWRAVTVAAVREESVAARTLVLDVPEWPGHLAGQHVDVRLTAADGYTAQRSYSLASAARASAGRAPDRAWLDLRGLSYLEVPIPAAPAASAVPVVA